MLNGKSTVHLIAAVAGEVFGLFIDDGSFAAAVLACVATAWLVVPHLPARGAWSRVLLFAGLACVLVAGALRWPATKAS